MLCKLLPAVLAVLCLLLSGCYAGKETDDVAFIIALGLDKAEDNKLAVTYQFAIPRAFGTAQGVGQELPGGPTVVNTLLASNSAEAHNLMKATMARYPNMAHLKALLISEELAREGVRDILVPFMRYREYRGTTLIAVVKGKTADFVKQNKPKIDFLPSKWYESSVATTNKASYYSVMDIHDFYQRLKNPGGSPYSAYFAINPKSGEDKPNDTKVPGDQMDAYRAGDIPRSGEQNPAEFVGVAIFSGDKMAGTLDTRQTRALEILRHKMSGSFFTIVDPLVPDKSINLNLRNGSKPNITVSLVEGRETITIEVFIEGEITSIASGVNYEAQEYSQILEEAVSQLITRHIEDFIQHTQAAGSDVFGFGYRLRSKFALYREVEQVNFGKLYSNAEVTIKVKTKLRRTGLMWRSSPFVLTGDEF